MEAQLEAWFLLAESMWCEERVVLTIKCLWGCWSLSRARWSSYVHFIFLYKPRCRRCSLLCGWRPVVAEHDVKGSSKVVGQGAAVAFVHEWQQKGQEQQSQEQKPEKKSQPTGSMQQPRLLRQNTTTNKHRHVLSFHLHASEGKTKTDQKIATMTRRGHLGSNSSFMWSSCLNTGLCRLQCLRNKGSKFKEPYQR